MKKFFSSCTLNLTNTLTNKREPFFPTNPNNVTMYVCGITPYDYAHLGHGRCYITFDVLYRLLTMFGYKVTYCRNFTDVDDKIIKRAEREFHDPNKYNIISEKFIAAYHEDMAKLNCLSPTYEPKVTEHIPQIIKFIEGLIDEGMAYVVGNDVYYNVEKFKEYGKLSKRDLKDLKAGARIKIREEKKNPLDFALWKSVESGPVWESPWGLGRPGWHIECSTMANEYLGETIEIHAGGMDLIFPHHENEIAQSEGLHHKTFARFWVHNAFVRIAEEKMSKSLGNFVLLRDVLKQYDPMVIRYYILQHHYRNPLDFSDVDIKAAEKSYKRIVKLFENHKVENFDEVNVKNFPLLENLIEALCNDLNIAKFFGIIFENFKKFEEDKLENYLVRVLIQQVLGLTLESIKEPEAKITPEIEELINQREKAREEKNWSKADEIRDKLLSLGVKVSDKKIND